MSPPKQMVPPSVGDLFLQTASNVFLELLTFGDLLQTIMAKVIEVTNATKGFLILVREDGGLDFKIARNMKREDIENPAGLISRKIIARVVSSRKPVLSGHAEQDPQLKNMESVQALLLKSILCVPLGNDRAVLGVIYLENHLTAGVFDSKARDMVSRVAEQATLALEMTRVLTSLKGERDRLEVENRGLREIFNNEYESYNFLGRSPAMQALTVQMARIAESPHSTLIQGESGTGKELVARILHATGPRRARPFVAVNCALGPSALFESELFGHAKGAFTGADRSRIGKVEAAEGGTLFLDEIGDMPLDVQPKLLRLLQERTYERVGENETRKADIRVVSATNKDVSKLISTGAFREDLYYRLNDLPIVLPALRDRPADIPELAQHFLREEKRGILGFTPEALQFMASYRWPGNVRELRTVVRRAAVYTTDGEPITLDTLLKHMQPPPGPEANVRPPADNVAWIESRLDAPYKDAVAELEGAYLRLVLDRHKDLSRAELAEKIGLGKRTLYDKLKAHGIR